LIIKNLVAFQGENKRVPDFLDAAERLELLLGTGVAHVSIDDLDRFRQAARSRRLPHFSIAARTQPLDELVSRDWFKTGLTQQRHLRYANQLFNTGGKQ